MNLNEICCVCNDDGVSKSALILRECEGYLQDDYYEGLTSPETSACGMIDLNGGIDSEETTRYNDSLTLVARGKIHGEKIARVDLYGKRETDDTGILNEIFIEQEWGCDGESLSRKYVTVGDQQVQKIDAWVVKDDTTKRGGIVQPARITIHGAIRVLLTFHRRAVRCIRQADIDTYFTKYHSVSWIRGLSYGLGSLILG
ncbi:hypothetical protein G5I_04934 [Acromyrmex echinatior]|uniref:Uncharacterized protein n=1 Tax=Acromyrmex echinatior TaxID=103372 RepID=F4WGY2_ACREC|nr:hypothetical protein G5I_04934 [Acromyrmex echinatior]